MNAPDELRKVRLIVAFALIAVAVVLETGAFLHGGGQEKPPGYGIPDLALVGGILA